MSVGDILHWNLSNKVVKACANCVDMIEKVGVRPYSTKESAILIAKYWPSPAGGSGWGQKMRLYIESGDDLSVLQMETYTSKMYQRFLLLALAIVVSCKSGTTSKLLIENGEPVMRTEFPGVMALYSKSQNICVVTFVSKSTAITAAHCVSGKATNEVGIKIARNDSFEFVSPIHMFWLKKFDDIQRAVEGMTGESVQKTDLLLSSVQYDVAVLVFPEDKLKWSDDLDLSPMDEWRYESKNMVTIIGFVSGSLGSFYSQSDGATANVEAWLKVNESNKFSEGSLGESRLKSARAYRSINEKIKELHRQREAAISETESGNLGNELAEMNRRKMANPWVTEGSAQPRIGRNRIMSEDPNLYVFMLNPSIPGKNEAAEIRHGDSGGPAFDYAGNIIGIASAMTPAKDHLKEFSTNSKAQISIYVDLRRNPYASDLFRSSVFCLGLAFMPPCADIPKIALEPRYSNVRGTVLVSSAPFSR